jgi:hypothetical protein
MRCQKLEDWLTDGRPLGGQLDRELKKSKGEYIMAGLGWAESWSWCESPARSILRGDPAEHK